MATKRIHYCAISVVLCAQRLRAEWRQRLLTFWCFCSLFCLCDVCFVILASNPVVMPTKRLSKPSQHTDSKENAIGTLIKQVGDSGSMGRRKRSRSVPGDANRDSGQAQAADRNESQEDDDGDDDDREAEATEDTNPQNGSEGRIRRHVNAAKLYALASGNCKRLKTDREPVEGQTQDHQVITVNVKVVNAGGSQPPANASVATTEPAVSNNTRTGSQIVQLNLRVHCLMLWCDETLHRQHRQQITIN